MPFSVHRIISTGMATIAHLAFALWVLAFDFHFKTACIWVKASHLSINVAWLRFEKLNEASHLKISTPLYLRPNSSWAQVVTLHLLKSQPSHLVTLSATYVQTPRLKLDSLGIEWDAAGLEWTQSSAVASYHCKTSSHQSTLSIARFWFWMIRLLNSPTSHSCKCGNLDCQSSFSSGPDIKIPTGHIPMPMHPMSSGQCPGNVSEADRWSPLAIADLIHSSEATTRASQDTNVTFFQEAVTFNPSNLYFDPPSPLHSALGNSQNIRRRAVG